MEPDEDEVDLPDEWQLEGFDDETAEWWLDNDFDCRTAMLWRAAYFDPETAAAWVAVGVGIVEASAWRDALEETELDIVDALRLWGEGLQPEEVAGHLARERDDAEDED